MTAIVDGHHHIWRQTDLPWLVGPMQPRIFGPYEPIRRDYPIDEFLGDLQGSGVVKSVYVQTNWAKDRFEDETAWVQQTAETRGWPHAIVAYADFLVDDVRPPLDRLARYGLVATDEVDIARLLADPGIIRNRLKILAVIENARRILAIQQSHGSLKVWLDVHHPRAKAEWVALFKKTFKVTGGEIVGEFLMSLGYLPGTHDESCPVYHEILALDPPWRRAAVTPGEGG